MANEINIMVGGEAGQGVQSVGFLLAKALTRWGYHIFADQDYESRVRGGHNFFRIRASDSHVEAIDEKVDILIALNKESIDLHQQEIRAGGIIIYDGEKLAGLAGQNLFNVPAERLAKEAAGDILMTNTVDLGAALGLVGYGRIGQATARRNAERPRRTCGVVDDSDQSGFDRRAFDESIAGGVRPTRHRLGRRAAPGGCRRRYRNRPFRRLRRCAGHAGGGEVEPQPSAQPFSVLRAGCR